MDSAYKLNQRECMETLPAIESEQSGNQPDNAYFCLHGDDVCLLPFGVVELYSEKYLKWMNDQEITKTPGKVRLSYAC
jgi:hypothetical protein